ncbi:hypothetical protein BGZ98_007833 [Dissophora globulifera]|nr:hypothetical protein BGZ98_007833 [Dissophora globulifera]
MLLIVTSASGETDRSIDGSRRRNRTKTAKENDMRLFFLCDYGDHIEAPIRLHICGAEAPQSSPSTVDTSEQHLDPKVALAAADLYTDGFSSSDRKESNPLDAGLPLRDPTDFLTRNAIPMLALLIALQESNDPHIPGTVTVSSDTAARIRASIRLLATLVHSVLLEFRERPTNIDCDPPEPNTAYLRLQESDILDGAGIASNCDTNRMNGTIQQAGAALHRLRGITHGDDVPGLCQVHHEMFIAAPQEERLRLFVEDFHGTWIPAEKSVKIQLPSREDARIFYGLLCDYHCVVQLKIRLAWHDHGNGDRMSGVIEQDIWELCEAIHKSNVQDLVLNCGAGCDSVADQDASRSPVLAQPKLGFRPMLGMICRTNLKALMIEGFDGDIFPGGASIIRQGLANSFSLQQFRESHEMVVPENIALRRLTFREWTFNPDVSGAISVIKCCPELEALEIPTLVLYDVFFGVQNATINFGNITRLIINEYSGDSVDVTLWRLEGGQPAIRKVQRRGSKPPSLFIQGILGLENWTITKCPRLWEHPEAMHNVIHNNIGSLKSMDLTCETAFLATLWPFIVHELTEAEMVAMAAALECGEGTDEVELDHVSHTVQLRMRDTKGHSLESLCSPRFEQTKLELISYDESFRPHLQPLSQVAATLSIGDGFSTAEELELLLEHAATEGLWFHELAWFHTTQMKDDVRFMAALQTLVRRPEVLKLTIRIDGGNGVLRSGGIGSGRSMPLPMEQIRTLLQCWNRLTGMSLGREYSRWMREVATQMDHPFRETLILPTGAGELMFASEHVVKIGAPLARTSVFKSETPPGPKISGPVIYALSCRCI